MPSLQNFQSCCRLCLTEKLDTSKSIFDETVEDRELPQKISQFVGIDISATDKITVVCTECITKVIGFYVYKEQCTQNQIKLQERMDSYQTVHMNGIGDINLQIKEEPSEEPMGDTDETMEDGTVPHETPETMRIEMIQVKNEPLDQIEESMEEEYNELPPALSPHLLDTDQQNGVAGFAGEDGVDPSIMESPTADESELQKTQFAAGLKLLRKNATPISCETLSKIELSYIEKCKAMVNMYQTLICACHNVPHQNLKGLLSHLRALRIWFPVFTCYNCMITFTDRSTFTRHMVRCPSQQFDTITKLSNLRKRSDVKTRLYQNFKCTICKFMFSFHEDFCRHVDEDHSALSFPFKCKCQRVLDNLENYKDHVYVSCMVDYYCDICFVTTKTLDDFQKHACNVHDNSEGFILLQDDNYKMRKPLMHVSPKEEAADGVILSGKRERRASVRAPIIETDGSSSAVKVINPVLLTSKANNKKCPICGKEYSSYKNMMRHYKVHSTEQGEASQDEEEESFYTCPDCGGMYNSTEWQSHLLEKHESKVCNECGKSFQFQTELEQHRTIHLNLKVYRDSKTQSYRSAVMSPGSDEEHSLTCEICDVIVSTKEELEDHRLTHDNASEASAESSTCNDKKTRKCDLCDKEFSTYSGLWDHNKRIHPERKTPSSNAFPKQCEYCDKVCTTGAAMYRHKLIHEKIEVNVSKAVKKNDSSAEEESYHTCKRCFKVFSSKYNLKNHMKCHGINTSPTGKKIIRKPNCNICQQVFNTIEEVDKHKEECHSEGEALLNENGEAAPFVFTCDVCVMTFPSKVALKKHKEKHIQETRPSNQKQAHLFCKYCKISFDSLVSLTKHMQQEHDEGAKPKIGKIKMREQFSCNICGKSFQTASALTTHIGWHKRGQNDSNTKLMKQNKVIDKLAQSIKIKQEPSDESPKFQCVTCLAELPNDTALQVHILEKHRSVSAIMLIPRCNTCNKDFNTQDEYETHKRLHDFLERQKQHEQSMLRQQDQGQMTSQKLNQSQQRLNVSGSPPKFGKNFPCKYCTAGFSRSDTLGAHIRQYHKEYVQTEFRCTQCDRVFDKQNSLTIHLKVHEKQRIVPTPSTKSALFSCSICSMGFDLPKDLRAHTISAHPF
ncbi:uncharacterized protein isoform X2 [Leptinotarsa decemlineata]|uniref:uncharacterized protein isoform X2 n=1 Tax=Leptinotarsa decemlineata TaxID=7539 RepID=UPI003D308D71